MIGEDSQAWCPVGLRGDVISYSSALKFTALLSRTKRLQRQSHRQTTRYSMRSLIEKNVSEANLNLYRANKH